MKFPDRVLELEIGIESDKELLAGLVHECPVMLEGIIEQKRGAKLSSLRRGSVGPTLNEQERIGIGFEASRSYQVILFL